MAMSDDEKRELLMLFLRWHYAGGVSDDYMRKLVAKFLAHAVSARK